MAKRKKISQRQARQNKAFVSHWTKVLEHLDRLPSVARRYETMTDKDGVTIRVPLPQRFTVQ